MYVKLLIPAVGLWHCSTTFLLRQLHIHVWCAACWGLLPGDSGDREHLQTTVYTHHWLSDYPEPQPKL